MMPALVLLAWTLVLTSPEGTQPVSHLAEGLQHSAPRETVSREESTHQPAQLIEAVVATVNRSVITLGQVEAEARVVLVRRGGAGGAERRVDDGLRAAVLTYLINQEIILSEARRLKLFDVERVEVSVETQRIEGLFADRLEYLGFLDDNGLSEGDVADIVRRDLRVGRFLKSRVQMLARLNEGELRTYFTAHPDLYRDRSFEQVRDDIEQELGRQRHKQAIRDWVSGLKDRAQIRVLRSFGDAQTATP